MRFALIPLGLRGKSYTCIASWFQLRREWIGIIETGIRLITASKILELRLGLRIAAIEV